MWIVKSTGFIIAFKKVVAATMASTIVSLHMSCFVLQKTFGFRSEQNEKALQK